jgi:NADPH-dependent 2,4-dienoyl-CoA reductase/sulfur reductase-like enzyme
MRVRETLVIVGGSVGGLRVAQAARQRGYAGRIVVIDAEDGLPYDKPALSKAVLTGDDPDLTLASPDELARLGIDHTPGVRAVGLDPIRRRLQVGDGPDVVFTELVIATGSQPRRLPHLDGLRGVHYLRTRADALAVRTCFAHAAVVIGGGFIGAEVAASARSLGLEVTILEAGPRLLARRSHPLSANGSPISTVDTVSPSAAAAR